MGLIFAAVVVFFLLSVSEFLWRRQGVHSEMTRKFVHITVGSFVALWPYFLSRRDILILSLCFMVVVAISQQFSIFSAIHSVQRPTSGELWFALTVCVLSLMNLHPHIYTAALLVMSLADGFAAIIGTRWGKGNSYSLLDSRKSVVGTSTFFITSLIILYGYNLTTPLHSVGFWIFPIAVGATVLENLGGIGIDNIVVPVTVAVALKIFS